MNNKLQSALGFAMKSGNCVSGDFAAMRALEKGKAKLFILEPTLSENSLDKYRTSCRKKGVPIAEIAEFGIYIGKEDRMVAAITDASFALMIRNALEVTDINKHGGVE